MTAPQGGLSTHVLDTALGIPGRDIKLRLYRVAQGAGESRELVCERVTNQDGRTDQPLLTNNKPSETTLTTHFAQGTYELVFEAADYFAQYHAEAPQPPFLDQVTLRFTIASDSHYHVPWLLSPWSYSTYRGS